MSERFVVPKRPGDDEDSGYTVASVMDMLKRVHKLKMSPESKKFVIATYKAILKALRRKPKLSKGELGQILIDTAMNGR